MQATLIRAAEPECTRSLVLEVLTTGGTAQAEPRTDIVEEWGVQSFPASDPPANW